MALHTDTETPPFAGGTPWWMITIRASCESGHGFHLHGRPGKRRNAPPPGTRTAQQRAPGSVTECKALSETVSSGEADGGSPTSIASLPRLGRRIPPDLALPADRGRRRSSPALRVRPWLEPETF